MPRIHNIEVDQYLADSVTISPEAIQEEFVRLPGDLAYYGELSSAAIKTHLNAKLERETMHARLRLTFKAQATATAQKLTEGDVEAMIDSDPAYHSARLAEVEAEATRHAIRSRFDAVQAKKEMLISLGAQLRREMDYDPNIRAQTENARVMGGRRGDF